MSFLETALRPEYVDVFYPGLNYFSQERLDPIIIQILRFFGAENSQGLYVFGELCILTFGLYALYRLVQPVKTVSFLWAVATTGTIVSILGFDPFFLKFHWFPYLCLCFVGLFSSRRVFWFVLLLFVAGLWSGVAGSLAVFGSALAVLLAYSLHRTLDGEGCANYTSITRSRKWYFGIGASYSLLISLLAIPVYKILDYPPGAMLVPLSPLMDPASHPQPLIGPYLLPNPVHYSVLLQVTNGHLALYVVFFLLLLVLTTVCHHRELKDWLAGLFILLINLALFWFEVLIPSQYWAFSPLQTIRRLIPGMGLIELTTPLLAFGLIIGAVFLVRCADKYFSSALLIVSTTLVIVSSSPGLRTKFFPSELYTTDHFKRLEILKTEDRVMLIKNSPSAFVVDTWGEWTAAIDAAEKRNFHNLTRLRKGIDATWTASAHPAGNAAKNAVDDRLDTRWATARAQRPGDYFQLDFEQPAQVLRVVLSIRATPTDFPRGIRVCGSLDNAEFWEIVEQPNWLGPIRWTPRGYPYFGPQSEVILDFPRHVEVKYLRFTQTGQSARFDWSIGEVKLYR